jgi:ankyrin repeat protein
VDSQDPLAITAVRAIRTGDTVSLASLLSQHPGLVSEQIHGTRTPLHVASDWPGYFPAGPATVRLLIEAGADPNAVVTDGTQAETPLHWTASSDDADVAEALISGGADIETRGGSIGTPLDNAVGYGCWNVARLLIQRGAQVSTLWHAAALGLMPQVEEFLAASPAPSPDDVTEAFWQACHGGQRRTAERLLASGADPHATPGYSDQTAAQIAAEPGTQRENLRTWLHDRPQ